MIREKVTSILYSVGLLVILPNALFWAVSYIFGINRAAFNLDYFLAGVLLATGWRRIGSIFLVIFLLFDILSLTGLVFPFVRVQDVAYLLGLLPHAALIWQFSAIGLFLLMGMVVYLLYAHGHKASPLASLVMLNFGLLAYGIYVYQPAEAYTDKYYRSEEKLIDSQSISFINNRKTEFIKSFKVSGDPFRHAGFTGKTRVWAESDPERMNKKILLVIAESWGVMKDARIQSHLISPLLDQQASFDWLTQGTMSAETATVGAELRELCGLETEHYNLKPVTEGFENCLPKKLKSLGYATAAIHGSVGIMYDRVHWYPRAGFDEMSFNETDPWETRCYSFPGTCDREIMDKYISHVFERDEKRFAYWLTLNTHALYDKRDIHDDLFDCTQYQLPENSETCRLTKLHAQFFHRLADILKKQHARG